MTDRDTERVYNRTAAYFDTLRTEILTRPRPPAPDLDSEDDDFDSDDSDASQAVEVGAGRKKKMSARGS